MSKRGKMVIGQQRDAHWVVAWQCMPESGKENENKKVSAYHLFLATGSYIVKKQATKTNRPSDEISLEMLP